MEKEINLSLNKEESYHPHKKLPDSSSNDEETNE